MKIKNPSAKFFAAILAFVIGGGGLHAANVTSTNESNTNTATMQADSSEAGTNGLAATNPAPDDRPDNKNRSDHAVRIDDTGIHVGRVNGSPPVDINWGHNSNVPIFGKTIVTLAAIVSPFIFAFGLPVVIIVTVFYFRHRQNKMMHDTVRAMVERGIPVTPELLEGLNARNAKADVESGWNNRRPRNRHLLPGLLLTGVGLALTGAHPSHAGTGGLIILFIGIAFLIVWLVERKQNGSEERGVNIPREGVQPMERKQDIDQQPPKI
jgi:hypothetical protein